MPQDAVGEDRGRGPHRDGCAQRAGSAGALPANALRRDALDEIAHLLRRPSAHDRDDARLLPALDREPDRPLDERLPLDRRWPPEERRPFEDDRPRPLVEERPFEPDDERLREPADERLPEPDDERLPEPDDERLPEPDDDRLRLLPDWPEPLRPPEDERLRLRVPPSEPPPFELCGVCECSVS
jgi:hypothetical protein